MPWVVRATVRTRDGSIFHTFWPGEPREGNPKVWTATGGKARLFPEEGDAKAAAIALMLNGGPNILDIWVEKRDVGDPGSR